MKGKLKSLLLSVFLLISVCALAACGNKSESSANTGGLNESQITAYENYAVEMIKQVVEMSDSDMEYWINSDDEFSVSAISSWKDAKEELGAYVEAGEQSYEVKNKTITINTKAKFEKGDADVELVVDFSNKSQVAATSLTFNVDYPMSVLLERAGLNTLMGICIVFLMLLFLSFLISLFKYIPKATAYFENKKAAKAAAKLPEAPEKEEPAAVQAEEDELVDDTELIAVIAAAIAASENTSTDSFVVRSIKKANRKKWQRA